MLTAETITASWTSIELAKPRRATVCCVKELSQHDGVINISELSSTVETRKTVRSIEMGGARGRTTTWMCFATTWIMPLIMPLALLGLAMAASPSARGGGLRRAGAGGCAAHSDCTGTTPHCDPAARQCTKAECLHGTDAECLAYSNYTCNTTTMVCVKAALTKKPAVDTIPSPLSTSAAWYLTFSRSAV